MEQSLSVSDIQHAYRPSRLSAMCLSRAVCGEERHIILKWKAPDLRSLCLIASDRHEYLTS